MSSTTVFFLLLLCSACKQNPVNKNKPRVKIIPPISKNYDSTKLHIQILRNKLAKNNASASMLEHTFVTLLTDSIFPYWYGTAWDFNGTTKVPGQGSIACGYFVSTTLQHIGVKLNRVKVGQMASQQIIEHLVTVNKKKVFSNVPLANFLAYVEQQGYGIYIVGLDNHVGFLYHDGDAIYFIHSKFYNPSAVVKELASGSGILAASKYRVVAKLSSDAVFLEHWVL